MKKATGFRKQLLITGLILLAFSIFSCDNFYVQEILRDTVFLSNITISATDGEGNTAEYNYGFKPVFSPQVMNYYVTVPKNTERFVITGISKEGDSVRYSLAGGDYRGSGEFEFPSAEMASCTIKVAASRKYMDETVYAIVILREQASWITDIEVRTDVGGDTVYPLNPGFNPSLTSDTGEFKVGVSHKAEQFSVRVIKRPDHNEGITVTLIYRESEQGGEELTVPFPASDKTAEFFVRVRCPEEDPEPLVYKIKVQRAAQALIADGKGPRFALTGAGHNYFYEGEAVGFTITPPFGNLIKEGTVTCITEPGDGSASEAVELYPAGTNSYNFIMPGKPVCLNVEWEPIPGSNGVRYVWGGEGDDTFAPGDGSSWATATNDLQSLIDGYDSNNYEIWIAKGTIHPIWAWAEGNGTEPGWASGITDEKFYSRDNWCFVLKDGVKIYGGFAGTETQLSERKWADTAKTIPLYETVLSGAMAGYGNTRHLLVAVGITEETVVDGLTITDSIRTGRTDPIPIDGASINRSRGGGIHTVNCGRDLLFSRLTIKNNFSSYGGGVYNHRDADITALGPTFSSCIIQGNTAYSRGGGMYNNGTGSFPASPRIENTVISVNQSLSGGAGIFNDGANPVLINTKIINNTGQGIGNIIGKGLPSGSGNNDFGNKENSFFIDMVGGEISGNTGHGVFVDSNASSLDAKIVLKNVVISGNGGGGLSFNNAADVSGTLELTNVEIRGNNMSGNGGGLYFNDTSGVSTLTLDHVVISGNKASGNGGGIWTNASNTTLTNVTVAGNWAAGTSGGGIYYNGGGAPSITNTIIWGNAAGAYPNIYSAPSPNYNNSLVQGMNGVGLLDEDTNPSFKEPLSPSAAPTSAGNYHLQSTSPLIGRNMGAYGDN